MKKNKDLITDILTHLKENDEARERFNKNFNDKSELSLNSNGELYYYIYKTDSLFKSKRYKGDFCNNAIKLQFLIHALSSPNGKPICGFLEEIRALGMTSGIETINHASTLRQTYLDELDKGESHDDALGLINKIYNKLCVKN